MIANKTKYLVIIAGPTAVGKTSMAIKAAQHFDSEIFSCDSRQVYQEMEIGTAKPSETELAQIKHHFISHKSILDRYTAGDFERDADQHLELYFKSNNIAIMTGGTGLYIKAVTEGLDDFPQVSEDIQRKLQEELDVNGLGNLVTHLTSLDPEAMKTIDSSNSRRVMRALGVCLASDKPYSSFLTAEKKKTAYKVIPIVLHMPREKLYERINLRVDLMMKNGLLDEVKSLYQHKDKKALQTVGYSELFAHLDGKISLDEAVELVKRNSRRYAKRQMTWFRNQGEFHEVSAESIDQLLTHIRSQLN